MIFTSLRLFFLFCILTIASQGIFYLLAFQKALYIISIDAFAEQRKAIDLFIEGPLKFLYLGGLFTGLILLIFYYKKYPSLEYLTLGVAWVLMVADLWLAMKENIPINELFHQYTHGNKLHDWEELRNQWLQTIRMRGIISSCSLLVLLFGFIYPGLSFHPK